MNAKSDIFTRGLATNVRFDSKITEYFNGTVTCFYMVRQRCFAGYLETETKSRAVKESVYNVLLTIRGSDPEQLENIGNANKFSGLNKNWQPMGVFGWCDGAG